MTPGPRGVLLVGLRGILSERSLAELLAGFCRTRAAAETPAFVFDTRTAVIAAGPAELLEAASTPAAGPLMRRPAALLTSPPNVDAIRAHALDLALAGLTRRAFVDEDAALIWLAHELDRLERRS
jgi:hypothetical protein